MQSVRINEAQDRLPELVEAVAQGEDITIVKDGKPVALLTSAQKRTSLRDLRPSSAGSVLRAFDSQDDLLEEMMDR